MLDQATELCNGCILAQGKSSPRPSPSCSTWSRHAIVRPAVKPPPVPAYAAEQKRQMAHPQAQPAAFPQRQYSPQANTFKSEQRRNQAPPPPSGPPPSLSLDTKTQLQSSTGHKPLPDPPNRPPPPCPVKPSVVNIFRVFSS